MPRFFFETDDGTYRHRDQIGQDLRDIEVARRMTLECLPEMARDQLAKGSDHRSFTMYVRDETGRVVYTACLSLSAQRFE